MRSTSQVSKLFEHNSIRCLTITEHQGGSDGCIRDSKYPSEAVDFPIDIKARSGVGVYADFGISVGKNGYQRQDMIFVSSPCIVKKFLSCCFADCDGCSNVFGMLGRCVWCSRALRSTTPRKDLTVIPAPSKHGSLCRLLQVDSGARECQR